jgi:hypothetical protein
MTVGVFGSGRRLGRGGGDSIIKGVVTILMGVV